MTKRDYILIAKTFADLRPTDPRALENWYTFVNAMIETLRLENSRFNANTFRTACGY